MFEFSPLALVLFVLGLLFGSLANVIIIRLPQKESFVTPRSRCPFCKKLIAWYDNIPVLSFIFLLGKCRHCKKRISIRYPLVELLSAFLFLAVYLKSGLSWFTIEMIVFSYGLLVVSFIDLDHMILPDSFTLSGIVMGLLGAFLNPERAFLESFLGVLLGGGFLWFVAYLYWVLKKQEGLGGGDIKLLAWIGAVLGWKSFPFIILLSSFLGIFIGGAFLLFKTSSLKSYIPFGPYLAVSSLAYFFFGDKLSEIYFNFFSISSF